MQRITQAVAAAINPKSLDAQMNDGDDGGGDLKDQLAVSDCDWMNERMKQKERKGVTVLCPL